MATSEQMLAYWTPERKAEASQRTKKQHARRKAEGGKIANAATARSSGKRRKALESAVWRVLTKREPTTEEAKKKEPHLVQELREYKKEDRSAFYQLVKAVLPTAPKTAEEAKPVSDKEILGGSLDALEEWWAKEAAGGAQGEGGEQGSPGEDEPGGAGGS
jgi:hypothetical protein